MRSTLTFLALALATVAVPAAAQRPPVPPRVFRVEPDFPGGWLRTSRDDTPRSAIGVTTSNSATVRDTLGVLVSSVLAGSPAEKAGIEEGNRIASINAVSLKLSHGDVGDDAMSGIMARRLTRELDRVKPGDEVELRVYANGQNKTVRVKTTDSDELYRRRTWTSLDDRAALGITPAATGSIRDTLGVFVFAVDDDGPAAKAGVQEGNRIASINGVDVRARRGDEDDMVFRSSNLNRLQREIERLKVGDDVTLRVYANGQYREMKVKAVRRGDLPRRRSSMIINGGGFPMPPLDMHFDDFTVDGEYIGDTVKRAIEHAMDGVGRGVSTVGRALDNVGRNIRIVW